MRDFKLVSFSFRGICQDYYVALNAFPTLSNFIASSSTCDSCPGQPVTHTIWVPPALLTSAGLFSIVLPKVHFNFYVYVRSIGDWCRCLLLRPDCSFDLSHVLNLFRCCSNNRSAQRRQEKFSESGGIFQFCSNFFISNSFCLSCPHWSLSAARCLVCSAGSH